MPDFLVKQYSLLVNNIYEFTSVDDEANGRDLDMSQFRLFVDNVKMNNFQGEVKIGVRQMDESEFDLYTEDSKPPIPGDRTGRITTWYGIIMLFFCI